MKALLVDGLNLVRRIYAAAEKSNEKSQTQSAEHALKHAINSSTNSLRRALAQHKPSHCLVVFDHGGKNWRHELFPAYKKNRAPMPTPLRDGLTQFETAFNAIGITSFSLAGFEADDVIATLATKIAEHDGHALIISTDRNYCQLLSAHISVFDHFAQRPLDAEMTRKRFQVEPQQLPDLRALAGDTGASVPGVKAVGIHTAAKLIGDYGSLEAILKSADDIRGKLGVKLREGKQDARLAKKIFTLKTNINLGVNLNQLRYVPKDG